jgi:hypothetical protein
MARFCLLLLISIYFSHTSQAAENVELPAPKALRASIITVSPGPGVDQRFGHSILRLHNTSTQEDLLFNWGTFSFEDPKFVLNFLRGKLLYWLSVESDLEGVLHFYQTQKRFVYEDILDLTERQRATLRKLLVENLQPERRKFLYDFFFYNCSTIPRDYIDTSLHGELHKASATWKAREANLRAYTRMGLSEWRLMPVIIDTILNRTVDAPLTAWTEMFHPLGLRDALLNMSRVDDSGQMVPQSKLVSSSQVLVHGQEHPSKPYGFPLFFTVSALLLFISGYYYASSRRARALFHMVQGSFLLFFGILAVFLLWAWGYSNHSVLPANANLWVMWPTDIILALLCWVQPWLRWGQRLIVFYARLHLAAVALFCGAFLAGYWLQDVSTTVLWLCPLYGITLGPWVFHKTSD